MTATKITHVFFDLDGVFADLDRALNDEFKCEHRKGYPNTVETSKKFEHLKLLSEKDGFAWIPPTEHMHNLCILINELIGKGVQCTILTSTGRFGDQHDIIQQKLRWLHAHVMPWIVNDGQALALAFAKGAVQKQQFAAPGHILIDDFKQSVDEFSARGGVGFHFDAEDPLAVHKIWNALIEPLQI